jgi:solute carrier family 35, member F1/2
MLLSLRGCFSDGDWWRALLYGQLISLFVTGTGICSQLLAQKYGVDIPTTQSFLNYLLLAIVYSIVLFGIRRENIWTVLKQKTLFYLPIAFVDVEANYFGTPSL